MSETVTYSLDGKVAVIGLDDGKANALSSGVLDALAGALDRAEAEARAVVLTGRPGRFSAGFDLAAMTASAESARALVTQGAELLLRMYVFPRPVVAACTGHALAAGALLLLAADTRVGARGNFKIGLNEVAIGLTLPIFAVELARDRLSKRHLVAATVQGRVYEPEQATDVGYLDKLVAPDDVVGAALDEARALAELSTGALAGTKQLLRERTVQHARDTLAADMENIAPPAGVKKP